jgi:hypothetical protein
VSVKCPENSAFIAMELCDEGSKSCTCLAPPAIYCLVMVQLPQQQSIFRHSHPESLSTRKKAMKGAQPFLNCITSRKLNFSTGSGASSVSLTWSGVVKVIQ